jgi:dye decolorizing peroxidase
VSSDQHGADRRVSRRHLLLGGAAAGLGAAASVGVATAIRSGDAPVPAATSEPNGTGIEPFYGVHQAGIETSPQAQVTYLALDLHDTVDAAALSQGENALADSEPELATVPARLTVTFGFGPGLVARTGKAAPDWLRPLPAFTIDRLEDQWTGGDLLIQVGADDPLTVAHAIRMLLKDSRSFATLRWSQSGFRRAAGSEKPGTTMRNLFGQVDGTVNLIPGSADFDRLVWGATAPSWLAGGTSLVFRRIAMDLDKWDRLDRGGRESAVGRTLAVGAPLTGTRETDEPDFEAKTAIGFPVIPEYSHIRRARSENPDERFHRRGYNYDDPPVGGAVSNSGLLFVTYQTDVDAQFVPVQKRLDELDLLNEWITPIGSAVFAIPPGCTSAGYIGDTLF